LNVCGANDLEQSSHPAAKRIAWFLLLLAVFMVILYWILSENRSPGFTFDKQVNLMAISLVGAAYIIALMYADEFSRGLTFPRNVLTFTVTVICINALIFVPTLAHGGRFFSHSALPFVAVSGVLIARNIMRSLMAWAHT
jgi:hypothetical protein